MYYLRFTFAPGSLELFKNSQICPRFTKNSLETSGSPQLGPRGQNAGGLAGFRRGGGRGGGGGGGGRACLHCDGTRGCLDLSAQYASGLGRRARRGSRGGPVDKARRVQTARGTRRLGARRWEGARRWKGARGGADAEASGAWRVRRQARGRVLACIRCGVPLFDQDLLQKIELKCTEQ
jgi:hypothetical protein